MAQRKLLVTALCLIVQAMGLLATPASSPAAPLSDIVQYTLNVTVGVRSPDCMERIVVLTNGELFYPLEVQQGQILQVTVINSIPSSFPLLSDGISVHWHGLNQQGSEWMDGVGYIHHCPILPGNNFTYSFRVNDPPGTYWYHSHAGMERVDGLAGPLIVQPPGEDPLAGQYNEEKTIFLMDWYHDLFSLLEFATSRPMDSSKVTNETGSRVWVDNPQSILINGQGYYGDCNLASDEHAEAPVCNVTVGTVSPGRLNPIDPQAPASDQGCSHFNLTVEPGKTYRLRLISAVSLDYLTFYVEGHNLTIIAADATPTEPLSVSSVDINSGQRYDVLLTADAEPRSYYMVAQPQFRPGSAAGYGFVTYSNSNVSALPPTLTPASNATAPWTFDQLAEVVTNQDLISPPKASVAEEHISLVSNMTSLAVPESVGVNVRLNLTQPVTKSGQLHWAFNDISNYRTPACNALMAELYSTSANYLATNEVQQGTQPVDYSLVQTVDDQDAPQVYVYGQPASVTQHPVTGQHIVQLSLGDVVELVIQNNPGNASNGDEYLVSASPGILAGRSNQEQHPIHLHGHHFWVVGTGMGHWNESDASLYNLENPIFRDTFTVPKGGWSAVRFVADNPGIWIMHCHYATHEYMGQSIIFSEALEGISEPPALPPCLNECTADFAGWAQSFVASTYGDSAFL